MHNNLSLYRVKIFVFPKKKNKNKKSTQKSSTK